MTNSSGSHPTPLNQARQRVSSANGPVNIQDTPHSIRQTKDERVMEDNGETKEMARNKRNLNNETLQVKCTIGYLEIYSTLLSKNEERIRNAFNINV